jgi:S1-C subfamily serine protease
VLRISTVTCDDGGYTGTGFAVGDDLVVTAAHVAMGARAMSVQTTDGDTVAAWPVEIVPEHDIAVLRLDDHVPGSPLTLAESVPDRGSELAVLGFPLSTFDMRIVNGIVTGLPEAVDYEGQHVDRAFITNAATNPGNSGGPVVDHFGHVIGVLSGGQNWDADDEPVEGVNFVVPVDDVRAGLDAAAGETTSLATECEGDEEADSGDEQIEVVTDDDDVSYAVAQLLYTHGLAINTGSYEAAFELFTPKAQRGLGGLDAWSTGVRDSYWRGIEVMESAFSKDTDTVTAQVALRTQQPASGDVTECSVWILDYRMVIDDEGRLLIDKVRGARPTPC